MPISFMLTSNRGGGGGGGGSRNESRNESRNGYWPDDRENESRGESRNASRGGGTRGESRGFFARNGGYEDESMRSGGSETQQLGFLRMHGDGGKQHHGKAEQYSALEKEIHRLAKELERMKGGGEDEGLEEVVAGFEEIMPQLVADAAMVVENPPKTWEKYLKEEKFPDIIRMEGGEFMKALEKADNIEGFLKEATHTLAGIMLYCMSKN